MHSIKDKQFEYIDRIFTEWAQEMEFLAGLKTVYRAADMNEALVIDIHQSNYVSFCPFWMEYHPVRLGYVFNGNDRFSIVRDARLNRELIEREIRKIAHSILKNLDDLPWEDNSWMEYLEID